MSEKFEIKKEEAVYKLRKSFKRFCKILMDFQENLQKTCQEARQVYQEAKAEWEKEKRERERKENKKTEKDRKKAKRTQRLVN